MSRNKIKIFICRGFNDNFGVPEIDNGVRARYRTAVVVKKNDWRDEWDDYDALVWRIIQNVADDLSAEMKISCPEHESGYVTSLSQWREWYAENENNVLDTPTEILFIKEGRTLCFMRFEDWSDVGKIEPYAVSYTYSFYSYDSSIDNKLAKSVRARLTDDLDAGEIIENKECPSPKIPVAGVSLGGITRLAIKVAFLPAGIICVLIYLLFVKPETVIDYEVDAEFKERVDGGKDISYHFGTSSYYICHSDDNGSDWWLMDEASSDFVIKGIESWYQRDCRLFLRMRGGGEYMLNLRKDDLYKVMPEQVYRLMPRRCSLE